MAFNPMWPPPLLISSSSLSFPAYPVIQAEPAPEPSSAPVRHPSHVTPDISQWFSGSECCRRYRQGGWSATAGRCRPVRASCHRDFRCASLSQHPGFVPFSANAGTAHGQTVFIDQNARAVTVNFRVFDDVLATPTIEAGWLSHSLPPALVVPLMMYWLLRSRQLKRPGRRGYFSPSTRTHPRERDARVIIRLPAAIRRQQNAPRCFASRSSSSNPVSPCSRTTDANASRSGFRDDGYPERAADISRTVQAARLSISGRMHHRAVNQVTGFVAPHDANLHVICVIAGDKIIDIPCQQGIRTQPERAGLPLPNHARCRR